jgi:carbonic anhydrase
MATEEKPFITLLNSDDSGGIYILEKDKTHTICILGHTDPGMVLTYIKQRTAFIEDKATRKTIRRELVNHVEDYYNNTIIADMKKDLIDKK